MHCTDAPQFDDFRANDEALTEAKRAIQAGDLGKALEILDHRSESINVYLDPCAYQTYDEFQQLIKQVKQQMQQKSVEEQLASLRRRIEHLETTVIEIKKGARD